jgi:hypothetical protein
MLGYKLWRISVPVFSSLLARPGAKSHRYDTATLGDAQLAFDLLVGNGARDVPTAVHAAGSPAMVLRDPRSPSEHEGLIAFVDPMPPERTAVRWRATDGVRMLVAGRASYGTSGDNWYYPTPIVFLPEGGSFAWWHVGRTNDETDWAGFDLTCIGGRPVFSPLEPEDVENLAKVVDRGSIRRGANVE